MAVDVCIPGLSRTVEDRVGRRERKVRVTPAIAASCVCGSVHMGIHDSVEIGPAILARIAKKTGLTAKDL